MHSLWPWPEGEQLGGYPLPENVYAGVVAPLMENYEYVFQHTLAWPERNSSLIASEHVHSRKLLPCSCSSKDDRVMDGQAVCIWCRVYAKETCIRKTCTCTLRCYTHSRIKIPMFSDVARHPITAQVIILWALCDIAVAHGFPVIWRSRSPPSLERRVG